VLAAHVGRGSKKKKIKK